MQGFAERSGDVKSVAMRWYVAGEGEPLVLLHGLTGAASNWCELAPRLAARFRVIVPELPGHGGSSPLPAAPNLDAYAEPVRLVAAREDAVPAAYVGHSMGGLVALRLAFRHPDAASGLVLAGAAGIASTTRRAEFWLTLLGHLKVGRRMSPRRSLFARRERLRYLPFGYWGASDPRALSERAVDGLLAGPSLHTDTLSAVRALVRDDPRLDLERVRCRCLVLWGARDRQVPVEDAFEYARRLRAPLRTIADCGHLLIAERPDACAAAIAEFLGQAERGAARTAAARA